MLPPFPGTIHRKTARPRGEYDLTTEQRQWLTANYPLYPLKVLARASGLSLYYVSYFAHRHNLHHDRKAQGSRHARLWKAERVRRMSGLQPSTRLNAVVQPYTNKQKQHRCMGLQYGYWYYEDNSEQGGERYNLYFDNDTQRRPRFEHFARKCGLNIKDGTNL